MHKLAVVWWVGGMWSCVRISCLLPFWSRTILHANFERVIPALRLLVAMFAHPQNPRVFSWEVEDPDALKEDLDIAGASCDHLMTMGAEELEMMRSPKCLDTLTVSQWDSRREVLQFVLQTVQQLQIPGDHYFCVVQLLDAAGVWGNLVGLWRQTVASMAALFMSLKLSRDGARGFNFDPLPEFGARATRFLNGIGFQGFVSAEILVMQEHELLVDLGFVISAPTVSAWIDILCCRAEVITGGRATQFLRLATDTAKNWSEFLFFQVNLCERNCPSDVAINMWSLALLYIEWFAVTLYSVERPRVSGLSCHLPSLRRRLKSQIGGGQWGCSLGFFSEEMICADNDSLIVVPSHFVVCGVIFAFDNGLVVVG